MDLTTYAGLQATALEFMTRAGQTGAAPTWIKLGEAKLNRELGPVETDAALVGVIGSRSIDISALSIVEPINLWIQPSGQSERELQKQPAGGLAFDAFNGEPVMYALDNQTAIDFDCPCSQAYGFRFRYRQRFALSDAAPSNWLLLNHPDIYLAATMMWGAGYNEDWANGGTWKNLLDEGVSSVRNLIRRAQKGTLRVDPAITASAGRYNIRSDV